jgi:hypothetical protein
MSTLDGSEHASIERRTSRDQMKVGTKVAVVALNRNGGAYVGFRKAQQRPQSPK